MNRVVELNPKEISDMFSNHGEVKRVIQAPAPHLNICFVEMGSVLECWTAKTCLQGKALIKGYTLSAKFFSPDEEAI